MKTTSRSTKLMRLAVLALLGFLGACGGGTGTAASSSPVVVPPVAQVKPGTWVVMGSSTAAGAGAPAGQGWVALLGTAYGKRGARITNIAKGGSVTYDGLSTSAAPVAGRPPADAAANIDLALAHNPVLLFVSYPSNDVERGFSTEETVANLLAIRSQALARGVPVMLLSTQPRNLTRAQLAQMRTIDERLAASTGGCFVDVRQPLAGADGRLSPSYDSGDGVHPNAAGHQVIANRVGAVLDAGQCVLLPAAT